MTPMEKEPETIEFDLEDEEYELAKEGESEE